LTFLHHKFWERQLHNLLVETPAETVQHLSTLGFWLSETKIAIKSYAVLHHVNLQFFLLFSNISTCPTSPCFAGLPLD